MAESPTPPAAEQDSVDALETPEDSTVTSVGTGTTEQTADNTGKGDPAPAATPPSKGSSPKQLLRRFNVYLLLFILILLLAAVILIVAYFQNKKASTGTTIQSQTLTQSTLEQLAASDASIGSSQQVLNIQSSTVFAGKVLVRNGLEVAGSLQVSGTTALTDLTASGTSQFGQVQVNDNLSVAGNTGLQGSLTVAKSLQVSGAGSFSGALTAPQVTTANLQLSGDLVLDHHIIAGGTTPSLAKGPALGSGGTASVSGSDTSGSISINVGSDAAAGCFAVLTFTSKYNATPHVQVTPISSGAGGLAYYVDRTTTTLSICDATAPPSGSSFGFDYFVVD